MKRKFLLFCYSLIFLMVTPTLFVHAQNTTYSPFKFSPIKQFIPSDLKAFKEKFERSIKTKDIKALRLLIHEGILSSYGMPEHGKKEFLAKWQLDKNPTNSNFWYTTDRILQMGGKVVTKQYKGKKTTNLVFPFISAEWPSKYYCYDFLALASKDVEIYQGTKIVDRQSYSILKRDRKREREKKIKKIKNDMIAVILPNGKKAQVKRDQTWVCGGEYEFKVGKIKGEWKLVSFIAGD